MKAVLTPLYWQHSDKQPTHRIEAAGVSLVSTYAPNRMAKVLALAGFTGPLEVYGPDGKLRFTVDIEKYSRKRLSETDGEGVRWFTWNEKSLEPLRELAKKASITTTDGQNEDFRLKTPDDTEDAGTADRFISPREAA